MHDIKFVIENKAMQYIKDKGAEAITIHGPAFGCPCCSPGKPPRATLHLPKSHLEIYDRYPVDGIVIYFPRAAYQKLSDHRTVRVALEGLWILKELTVNGFSYIR